MLRNQTKKVSKTSNLSKSPSHVRSNLATKSKKGFSTFKKVGSVPTPSQPPSEQPKTQQPKPTPQQGRQTAKPAVIPKQGTPVQAAAEVNEAHKSPQTEQTPQQAEAPKVKKTIPTTPESAPTPPPSSTTEAAPQAGEKTVKTTTVEAIQAPLSAAMGGKPKTAILMLNMGGPKEPQETKSFLTNLFSDPMIINLGKFQWAGVRAAASRTPKVQKQYEKIGGSPIAKWTDLQGQSLTDVLDITSPQTAPHKHYIGFRYANPDTHSALQQIKKDGVKRVIAFSQFPMYSCTTTGSSLNDLWTQSKAMGLDLEFSVIDRWHDDGGFHEAIAHNIKQQILNIPKEELQKTAILFSAHSVPLKTMNGGDQYPAEVSHTVEQTMVKLNGLMKEEGKGDIPQLPHMLCWQSKVGFLPWLKPSTTTAIEKVKSLGFDQAIIVPVAFTSDHIETLHEIDIEYKELAEKHGVKLLRAESLNNSMFLTKAQANIVKKHIDNDEIVRSHQYRIKCNECVQPEICRSVLGYDANELFQNKRIPKA